MPAARPRHPRLTPAALRCRRKFLRIFPRGFRDPDYLALERDYKWRAHESWQELLDRPVLRSLLRRGQFAEIAARAVRIEGRTNLIFSFEKMALRDAVRSPRGVEAFARGLDAFLHGAGGLERRFERWCEVLASLPRRQTRVLTWPVATVFGFLAHPTLHLFHKPNVNRAAARAYGFELDYTPRPGWPAYGSLLAFASRVGRDLRDLRPRDAIDVQSFLWVLGSDEYAE